ncbi:MAG: ferrochelatase [Pyrinomonadaceae bacterium]
MSPHDAILVVSFGGPEGMGDVVPFLENVLRGRNVPRERLLEVAEHYKMFGGVSPINQQNRNLIAALRNELKTNGPDLPIYWGNRNWRPLLPDTVEKMAGDGIKHALAFVTSAYSSYSSCRQYLQNIEDARQQVGPAAPEIVKLRAFYNHPLFIQASVEQIRAATRQLNATDEFELIFTAHSIPESMAQNCEYTAELLEAGELIAHDLSPANWQLVFQSRSGSPTQPWLGPDICEQLQKLALKGEKIVVVAPIGFVSDHMEVIYDLDVQARQLADHLGLRMIRSATVGTHALFVKMVRELILEQTEGASPQFLGSRGPGTNACGIGCCPAVVSRQMT